MNAYLNTSGFRSEAAAKQRIQQQTGAFLPPLETRDAVSVYRTVVQQLHGASLKKQHQKQPPRHMAVASKTFKASPQFNP